MTFDEEFFEISTTIFSHPHEIWDISASKEDPDLFFTCYREGNDIGWAKFWFAHIREPLVLLLLTRWFYLSCSKNITVIDGKKTQSKASLWRMKRGNQEQEEDGHEGGMHHHQTRGELEHVLSLDIGDGSVKK